MAWGNRRRRRAVEAARVLPFAGLFLFLLPVLWGGVVPVRTAWGGLYIFGAWFALILTSAILSHLISRGERDEGGGDD